MIIMNGTPEREIFNGVPFSYIFGNRIIVFSKSVKSNLGEMN